MKRTTLLIAVLLLSQNLLFSQKKETKLNLFITCNFCDVTYVKQNLEYAEFVRDQNFADVHLFFRNQRNGSGGRAYEIEFIGQNVYKELNDKITFSTTADNTSDEVRNLILKNIRFGLIRYWIQAGYKDKISIKITKPKANTGEITEEVDKWNKWVFRLGARGFFNGQETYKSRSLSFNVSARRVTEKNKFSFWVNFNDNKSVFKFEGEEDFVSKNSSKNAGVSNAFSINDHWSAGFFARAGSSDYNNKDLFVSFLPAIEYNFFTYKESTKQQLTLGYKVGGSYTNYTQKTVFNQFEEYLWSHDLSLQGSVNKTWGRVNGSISYESYLHDASLNEFSFYLGTNVRLFKGFSFNLNGNYNITNNQISLPAGNLSVEEILLRQQQIKSGYNYFFSMGLNYTFGSRFNSVVNPRFGF